MSDTYNDVLDILERNDGACLYWQMPDVKRGEAAADVGAVKRAGDLLVHPRAVEIEDGMAYTMESLDDLCEEYATWNAANGLKLGSADEHLFDENLTDEQRAWLRAFCKRWDAVNHADDVRMAIERRAHDEGLSK
jgi:hypothetical protein